MSSHSSLPTSVMDMVQAHSPKDKRRASQDRLAQDVQDLSSFLDRHGSQGASVRRPSVGINRPAGINRPDGSMPFKPLTVPGNNTGFSVSSNRKSAHTSDVAVVEELIEKRATPSARTKRPADENSIGLSILESGRASVRRTSLSSMASSPTVVAQDSTGRRPSLVATPSANAGREARAARFAAATAHAEGGSSSKPAEQATPALSQRSSQRSSPREEEPSVGLSLIERQRDARRSARRNSVTGAEPVAEPRVQAAAEPDDA